MGQKQAEKAVQSDIISLFERLDADDSIWLYNDEVKAEISEAILAALVYVSKQDDNTEKNRNMMAKNIYTQASDQADIANIKTPNG